MTRECIWCFSPQKEDSDVYIFDSFMEHTHPNVKLNADQYQSLNLTRSFLFSTLVTITTISIGLIAYKFSVLGTISGLNPALFVVLATITLSPLIMMVTRSIVSKNIFADKCFQIKSGFIFCPECSAGFRKDLKKNTRIECPMRERNRYNSVKHAKSAYKVKVSDINSEDHKVLLKNLISV